MQYCRQFFLLLITVLFFSSSVYSEIPSGYYYFVKNKTKTELKTALHTYCAPLKVLDYGGGPSFTWEGFYSTDNINDTVIDMYSKYKRKFNGFSAVDSMHIEHSLPKSWWGGHENNAYKDLYHLYPADGLTNTTKSNLPLGEVTGIPDLSNGKSKIGLNGFGTSYFEKCFEPADEFKGDFARSYFYISTVYEDLFNLWQSPMMNNNVYPVWKPWALDLLLKWHRQDPVSAKELARIEQVYNIQGNRNPFIDYPTLAEYIWGADTTKIFPFPVEINPFLLTPRSGSKIDFGVILQNDTRINALHIQGANINSTLSLAFKNSHNSFSLSSSNLSTSSVLAGVDVNIQFSPTSSGLVRDTLLISGGGLAQVIQIPIKALASADFITLEPKEITPIGGTLQWISDPEATDYKLTHYYNAQEAGDLIISDYIEGTSWNKAIQLYNGTSRTIDLSKYSLQKQSNGYGGFYSTLRLSGQLLPYKTYAIVHKDAIEALKTKANFLTDTLLQFNGNDAIQLIRGGVTIDMVGQANAGADKIWGENLSLKRIQSVNHPVSVFNINEWNIYPIDTYNFLGNHNMVFVLADPAIILQTLTGKTTSYKVQDVPPNSTSVYSIEAIRPSGNRNAINTMQLKTSSLDVPEVIEATNIGANHFTANWESVLYANNYLLDVYSLTGQSETTETEGFPSVGSSGTPLPNGWTGNASGNYTSATSSGIAIPSISLKNNGEWLQTKTYPYPVSKLTFMYRYASTATGSSVVIYGFGNGNWTRIDSILYVNTTKAYPVYTFTNSQALTAFKFIYRKAASGNLAIDDVSATYGNQDTIYIHKNKVVENTQFDILNLNRNTNYYYKVRANLNGSKSDYSYSKMVKTADDTAIDNFSNSAIKIKSANDNLVIEGLRGDETIQVFTVMGVCVFQQSAKGTEITLPNNLNGVLILSIWNKDYQFRGKILK